MLGGEGGRGGDLPLKHTQLKASGDMPVEMSGCQNIAHRELRKVHAGDRCLEVTNGI